MLTPTSRGGFLQVAAAIIGGQSIAWTSDAATYASQDPQQEIPLPAIPERAVYLNIGNSLPPLTVNEWSEQRWSVYLDALTAAHFNSLQFGIWQDVLSDFAAAPSDKERNRQLHES